MRPRVWQSGRHVVHFGQGLPQVGRRDVRQSDLAIDHGISASAVSGRYRRIWRALGLEPNDGRYLP